MDFSSEGRAQERVLIEQAVRDDPNTTDAAVVLHSHLLDLASPDGALAETQETYVAACGGPTKGKLANALENLVEAGWLENHGRASVTSPTRYVVVAVRDAACCPG